MSLSHDATRAKIQAVKELLIEKVDELRDARARIADLERLSEVGAAQLAAAKARITNLELANVDILHRLAVLEGK